MPNNIRIITYNIHRCIGGDRNISPERISDVISVHQPDVVALQEVDYGQVRPTLYDQAAIPVWAAAYSSQWEQFGSGMKSCKVVNKLDLAKNNAISLHKMECEQSVMLDLPIYESPRSLTSRHPPPLGLPPEKRGYPQIMGHPQRAVHESRR